MFHRKDFGNIDTVADIQRGLLDDLPDIDVSSIECEEWDMEASFVVRQEVDRRVIFSYENGRRTLTLFPHTIGASI